MKTTKLFFMAALALTFAACSNDDNIIQNPVQQPAKAEGIPFTATISMGESASTRALSDNGTKIEATWATGEKVALIYNGVKDEMTVSAVNAGVATITGTITGSPSGGDAVTIIYPSDAADGTTGNVKSDWLSTQDGTLKGTSGTSIEEEYDVRKGSGALNASGTSFDGTVSLTNQNAIFKLTLKDIDGTNDVSATSVVISDQTGTVTTVTPASATNVMYVALPTTATTLKFLVTGSDSKKYFNMASGLSLNASYYQSTVKLATVGDVILSTGKCAKAGTGSPVAMIAYLGSDNGEAAPYNHGLALALSDANGGSTCQWSTSFTNVHGYKPTSSSFASESGLQYNATQNSDAYPAFKAAIANNGTAAPTGCSAWFLASGYQWQKMAGAVGGLNNLGLQGGAFYWSSSEFNPYFSAWSFNSGSGNWYNDYKDSAYRVRACLAF